MILHSISLIQQISDTIASLDSKDLRPITESIIESTIPPPITDTIIEKETPILLSFVKLLFNLEFINSILMGITFYIAIYILLRYPKEFGRRNIFHGAAGFAISQIIKTGSTILFPLFSALNHVFHKSNIPASVETINPASIFFGIFPAIHRSSVVLELFKVFLLAVDIVIVHYVLETTDHVKSKDPPESFDSDEIKTAYKTIATVALGWTVAENISYIIPLYMDESKWLDIADLSLSFALNVNYIRVVSMFIFNYCIMYRFMPTNIWYILTNIYGLITYCVTPTAIRLLSFISLPSSLVLLAQDISIFATAILAYFCARYLLHDALDFEKGYRLAVEEENRVSFVEEPITSIQEKSPQSPKLSKSPKSSAESSKSSISSKVSKPLKSPKSPNIIDVAKTAVLGSKVTMG